MSLKKDSVGILIRISFLLQRDLGKTNMLTIWHLVIQEHSRSLQ